MGSTAWTTTSATTKMGAMTARAMPLASIPLGHFRAPAISGTQEMVAPAFVSGQILIQIAFVIIFPMAIFAQIVSSTAAIDLTTSDSVQISWTLVSGATQFSLEARHESLVSPLFPPSPQRIARKQIPIILINLGNGFECEPVLQRDGVHCLRSPVPFHLHLYPQDLGAREQLVWDPGTHYRHHETCCVELSDARCSFHRGHLYSLSTKPRGTRVFLSHPESKVQFLLFFLAFSSFSSLLT